jgi:hypothetical protein
MDSAFDVVLGCTIPAVEAGGSRNSSRYVCRLCQQNVFFVSAGYAVAHFSHYRAEEGDYCAARVAAFGALDQQPFSVNDLDRVNAVLACEVSISRRGTEIRYFIIYRPRPGVQRICFKQGGSTTRHTIHAAGEERQLSISQRCSYFSLEEFDHDGVHTQLVEGFDLPVVFRLSESRSIRIPRHRKLRAGGRYLAVLPSGVEVFPESLEPAVVPSELGLFAVEFLIPKKPAFAVTAYLSRVLGMEVEVILVDYTIVSPVLVHEVAPDCWAGKTSGTWTVRAYCDPLKYPSPASFLIRRRSVLGALDFQVLEVPGKDGLYDIELELNSASATLIHVGLGNTQQADFIFEIRHMPSLPEPLTARLGMGFLDGGAERSYAWSSHRVPSLLREVSSNGELTLASVTVPMGVHPEMVVAGKVTSLSEESGCDDLRKRLRSGEAVVIRAEGYPHIKAEASRRAVPLRYPLKSKGRLLPNGEGTPAMREAYRHGVISAYALRSRRSS